MSDIHIAGKVGGRITGLDESLRVDVQKKRVLSVSASGEWDFPFCVCPVDDDGIDMGVIAQFERHEDALLFVETSNACTEEVT